MRPIRAGWRRNTRTDIQVVKRLSWGDFRVVEVYPTFDRFGKHDPPLAYTKTQLTVVAVDQPPEEAARVLPVEIEVVKAESYDDCTARITEITEGIQLTGRNQRLTASQIHDVMGEKGQVTIMIVAAIDKKELSKLVRVDFVGKSSFVNVAHEIWDKVKDVEGFKKQVLNHEQGHMYATEMVVRAFCAELTSLKVTVCAKEEDRKDAERKAKEMLAILYIAEAIRHHKMVDSIHEKYDKAAGSVKGARKSKPQKMWDDAFRDRLLLPLPDDPNDLQIPELPKRLPTK